jgi:hypothetical protein
MTVGETYFGKKSRNLFLELIKLEKELEILNRQSDL